MLTPTMVARRATADMAVRQWASARKIEFARRETSSENPVEL
jgi:hypothetical protein